MGCGASTQNPNNVRYEEGDEEDEDERLSDAGSVCSATSETSTVSNRSMTKVTTTRGRMASSSTTTPKLNFRYSVQGDDDFHDEHGVFVVSGERHPSKAPEHFLFGDFSVDPKDVARQRVERLNRIRRPSRHNEVIKVKEKRNDVFVLNDFVIQDIDEETYLPEQSFASIQVPTGFRRLASIRTRVVTGHTDRVKALVLGREEKSYLSSSVSDCVVSMSDLSGQELNCYPAHEAYIIALCISRDGKLFASSARDGGIAVWEYSTNREHAMKKQVKVFTPEEASNAVTISMAFGFNGRHLIAGGQDGRCRVWDLERGGGPFEYENHTGVIVSVSAHPNDFIVASASGDRSVHVWRFDTGEMLYKLLGHESAVISVTCLLDGQRILSNDDRSCRVWSINDGQCELVVHLNQVIPREARERYTVKRTPDPGAAETLGVLSRRYPSFVSRLSEALAGPNSIASRAAQMERVTGKMIFTVSTALPGPLSSSYFAVACTTSEVYIINLVTGSYEGTISTKAPVFAMHAGANEGLIFGDIFGNIYLNSCR